MTQLDQCDITDEELEEFLIKCLVDGTMKFISSNTIYCMIDCEGCILKDSGIGINYC